jgi:hypothetical protein
MEEEKSKALQESKLELEKLKTQLAFKVGMVIEFW